MMVGSFCFFFGLFLLYYGSFHSLILLLYVEILVLFFICYMTVYYISWFSCLMFLLVAVCLGAYGVSLLVSVCRLCGPNYLFFF